MADGTALDPARMREQAAGLLESEFGRGAEATTGWAPGRCTLVGEHVDYAGGRVLAMALELGIAVALRPSADGVIRVASGGRRIQRREMEMAGDIGDRVIAALVTAAPDRRDALPVEVAVAATLPESAGLASSAALTCAVLSAELRRQGRRVSATEMVQLALHAERDVAGVQCGPLDPHVVVEAPRDGVLLLDCSDEWSRPVPWPWDDVVVCVCATGETHDVAGAEYTRRRTEVEEALRIAGAATVQDVDDAQLHTEELTEVQRRRLRHAVGEDSRTVAAEAALRSGDVQALGRCIAASHGSLRNDHEVSTPLLDRVVAAADWVPGCLGARLVGAGFGGSVMALTRSDGAAQCAAAMAAAAGVDVSRTWTLRPAPGMAALAADVIAGG